MAKSAKKNRDLENLVREMLKRKGDFWLRFLYLYPDEITEELLSLMASDSRICAYLDMPIQHINATDVKSDAPQNFARTDHLDHSNPANKASGRCHPHLADGRISQARRKSSSKSWSRLFKSTLSTTSAFSNTPAKKNLLLPKWAGISAKRSNKPVLKNWPQRR